VSTSEGDRNPAKHALTMFDLTGYESDHEDTRRTAGNRESQRTGGPRRDRKSRGERHSRQVGLMRICPRKPGHPASPLRTTQKKTGPRGGRGVDVSTMQDSVWPFRRSRSDARCCRDPARCLSARQAMPTFGKRPWQHGRP
jgi:hypothetical protein